MKSTERLAVIDLETTGCDPIRDRITEIAIILIDGGLEVQRWSSLVNPGVSIPSEIQTLTGITNAMVSRAPKFAQLCDDVCNLLSGRLFVAHNARFDYGFLKNAFAQSGVAFTADVLCTVRLSRRLEPEHAKHNLDILVERHGLVTAFRHRAMGDAELVVQLLEKLRAEHTDEVFEAACKRLLKTPSLPQQLPPDVLDNIPDEPGVYIFYGANDAPLYIGKSIALRERVRSHFSNDYRTANDIRLSSEMRRIEVHPTAGEFGALITEVHWISERFPALNKALRKNEQWQLLDREGISVLLSEVPVNKFSEFYGPFSTKRAAKSILQGVAASDQLCWTRLKLERREGACFGYQVRKCAGLCVGLESEAQHQERFLRALAPWKIPNWPFKNLAVVFEESALVGPQYYLFDQWCFIATLTSARDLSDFVARFEPVSSTLKFDPYVFRLLLKALKQGTLIDAQVAPNERVSA
jgi:DNA polymerase III subunit epsilon